MNGRNMKYLRVTWRAAVTQTTSLRIVAATLCTYSVSWLQLLPYITLRFGEILLGAPTIGRSS